MAKNGIRIGEFIVDLYLCESGSLGITVYSPGTAIIQNPDNGDEDYEISDAGTVRDIFVTPDDNLVVTSL